MTNAGRERPDEQELAGLAVELARQAGALAVTRRSQGLTVATKSSPTDVVTDVDRAVEEFLVGQLREHRPGDLVRGEEGVVGEPGPGTGNADAVRWVIDPIDGTVNFMLGLPQWAVSIAAELEGVVLAGCVFNPVTGALFHAARGHGSWLDGQQLAGPRNVPVAEAVVATGFAYDAAMRERQGQVLAHVLPRVGNIRRMGSAALDLCALAAGWVDAYYEACLNEWDYAAGALMATEAGVHISGLRGQGPGSDILVGAHPARAPEFIALLEAAGA